MGKNIYNHTKGGRMKELGQSGVRGAGELGGLDFASSGGGTEADVQSPQKGNCLSQRRNI